MKKSTEKSLQFFFGRYLSEPLCFLEKSLIPNNTNEVAKGMIGFLKGIYEDFDEEEFFFELEQIKNAYENEFNKLNQVNIKLPND